MNPRVSEHDEYLLSLLLDNDLPEAEAAALRLRLQSEPDLRACYDSLVRLNTTLEARRTSQPVLDLNAFHGKLMQRLAEEVSAADELLIGRSLDGELDAAEREALQQRLAAEPALQTAHDAYTRLETALAAKRADQPQVDYRRFHKQLMQQVAHEGHGAERTVRFPFWLRIAGPLAAAAAIALIIWLNPLAVKPGGNPVADDRAVAMRGPGAETGTTQNEVLFARANPAPASAGPVEVAYGRWGEPASNAPSVQVSYVQSAELAQAVRSADDEQANKPARKVFFAAAAPVNRSSGGDGDFLDSAPM